MAIFHQSLVLLQKLFKIKMRYLFTIILFISLDLIFSQNRKINLDNVEIIVPSILEYKECYKEKISKHYNDFTSKNNEILGLYLNNESFKFNRISKLYNGLTDFGLLIVNKELKKEHIDYQFFNEIIRFKDSIYQKPNNKFLNNKFLNNLFIEKPQLIDTKMINNKLKNYVSLVSFDSTSLYCLIDNHLNIKNRYLEFIYYVRLKDSSYLDKAINNNNYLIDNIFKANNSSISDQNLKYIAFNNLSEDFFFTKDGFNLGTLEDFASYFSEGNEYADINGIKISSSQFWKCVAKLFIPTLQSNQIANALEKQDFKIFIPKDKKLDEIMKCIGNGFSVGESYIDLCIDRYQVMGTYSIEESQKFCRCEYENLLVRVDDYDDYVKYYDEIGDQNKPSYNEIILPCRNSFKKAKGSNLYNPNDIEGFSDQSIVKLLPDGTTFKVKLTISGIVRYFVYDTGASELVINSELEKELLKTGKISLSDYVDSKQFEIADGSLIEAKGVRLNNIIVGGFRVNNVVAYITEEGGMLCGMGLMNKFRTWELDKENKMITIYK